MGRKRAGASPLDPGFTARSLLALARFGVCATLSRSWGYFAAHLRTLIWRLSFIKCFSAYFSGKCVPNRFWNTGRNGPSNGSGTTTAKTSECQRAGHKKRGGGGPPPATLCVRAFSRESLDPPPGTAAGTHPLQGPPCDGPNGTACRRQRAPAPVSAPSKCEKTLKYQGFHLLFLSPWCKITQYAIVQKKRTAPRLRPGQPGAPSPVGRLRL